MKERLRAIPSEIMSERHGQAIDSGAAARGARGRPSFPSLTSVILISLITSVAVAIGPPLLAASSV
jgi:hypothetical protein